MTAALGDSLLDPGSISRRDNTSDATGHFTIKNAPSGMVRLHGMTDQRAGRKILSLVRARHHLIVISLSYCP